MVHVWGRQGLDGTHIGETGPIGTRIGEERNELVRARIEEIGLGGTSIGQSGAWGTKYSWYTYKGNIVD